MDGERERERESIHSTIPLNLQNIFHFFIREHDFSSRTEKAYIKNTPYTYGTLIILVMISRLEDAQ